MRKYITSTCKYLVNKIVWLKKLFMKLLFFWL